MPSTARPVPVRSIRALRSVLRVPFAFALPAMLAVACSSEGAADIADIDSPEVSVSALDRTVDPCTDFYAFACGGYDQTVADDVNTPRASLQVFNAQRPILERVFDRLRYAPASPAETKAGTFYARCLADDGSGMAAAIAARRGEIRAAVTPAELATVLAREQRRGSTSVFQSVTVHTRRRVSLTLLALPYSPQFAGDAAAAHASRLGSARTTLATHEPDLAAAEVEAIAEGYARANEAFDTALAAVAPAFEPEPGGLARLQELAPHVDWSTLLIGIGLDLPPPDILIYGAKQFVAIDRAIAALSPGDITAFLTVNAELSVAPYAPANRELCQQLTIGALPDAIQAAFLAENTGSNDSVQAHASSIWNDVRHSFVEQLADEPWIDDATRREALAKVQAMAFVIGGSALLDDYASLDLGSGPDFYATSLAVNGYRVGREMKTAGKPASLTTLGVSVDTINAFYDWNRNLVTIPAGFLGAAFVSDRAARVANFARLGSVLGHELTHGFDNIGRTHDENGEHRDWWTSHTSEQYITRATCVVDQYAAFEVPGVLVPTHIDGARTLTENIADNGGVKLAYRAAKIDGQKAPLVEGFTPPQQFFVSYAQQWCTRRSTESLSEILAEETHSPEKARVNIPLQNFPSFADAFQCKRGSAMAPANRCAVW